MGDIKVTDRTYEIQELERIIAEITSGIIGAIPEQADRELARRVLGFIEKDLMS